MCFTFKKNNRQTKKPVNCFLQDDASAGIQSLQTSVKIKLCQNLWNGLREVSLFTRRGGLLKIGGDQVFFLRLKGGIKRFFQIKKGGSLIFFKERKYFDKHFRTQMEFLLILQKRCSYESVSCCNSSKRG